jgi:hypothetical protein
MPNAKSQKPNAKEALDNARNAAFNQPRLMSTP